MLRSLVVISYAQFNPTYFNRRENFKFLLELFLFSYLGKAERSFKKQHIKNIVMYDLILNPKST